MDITPDEVFETTRMILHQHLDIRTVTLGINLKDCAHTHFPTMRRQVARRILPKARKLVTEARRLEAKFGVPIVNRRLSVTPVSLLLEPHADSGACLRLARTLDEVAAEAGVDFLGGFGGHVHKGRTRAEDLLLQTLPRVLCRTARVCGFLNVGSTVSGLNLDAVNRLGPMLLETAAGSPQGLGCAKFVAFVNAPEDNPFMAGAFHGTGEGEFSLNVGISGPGVVRAVVAEHPDCDLAALSEVIKRTVFKITRVGELVGRELAAAIGVDFGVVDISLASTTAPGDSVAGILEAFGLERVGAPGSTLALALMMDAVKKGGAMASAHVGGLSGTFIPVSEDERMIAAVQDGALSLDKLEALTAVCSVGLDMFAVPGDTPPEALNGIIADELAIGIVNHKTTAVRVIPVPGAKAGDLVHFGGLLGDAPVMPVSPFSGAAFLRRGGRLPAPVTSLRN